MTPDGRPPELVAASDRPVELAGGRAAVSLAVPPGAAVLVPGAEGAPETARVYLNVEDITGERNPGVVYGVFLNMAADAAEADRARLHVGNLAFFGMELMADPDQVHDAAPGFRHTFDVTSIVEELRRSDQWDPARIEVSFEPILPEPAPGRESDAQSLIGELAEDAAAAPVQVGRVSLFVD
jgi:hypothetical protein